jgi:hypothetical protein
VTEIPTIIDPSATKKYPSITGLIIVGISVVSQKSKSDGQKEMRNERSYIQRERERDSFA